MSVSISLDSPSGSGAVGYSLRVFARRDARVIVTRTLDPTWIALDDTSLMLDERAQADVRHTVLGAGGPASLAGDLRGDEAKSRWTRYLGTGERARLQLRAAPPRLKPSAMNADGVRRGGSKTLRGTIDFVRGCKGANGQEVETVLIADERADNRTVPVILCNQDDVAGNHGATIGHVRSSSCCTWPAAGSPGRPSGCSARHAGGGAHRPRRRDPRRRRAPGPRCWTTSRR
ncbi:MAG: SufD family Fe-S cluster assembly protein [Eggerthellaceae bacterium]